MIDTSLDTLLNGRIALEQPKKGYRVAVDTLLLASAVPMTSGQSAVEFGCGVGGAMLALACRAKDVFILGIESQNELASLCATNIARNGLADRLSVRCADVMEWRADKKAHHLFMNPPYHDEARHDASADDMKRRANTEYEGEIGKWIESAAAALTKDGIMTLIHRADREAELVLLCQKHFRRIEIKPVRTKPNGPAKRFLLRARKHGATSLVERAPFILHDKDGGYSAQAEDILRGAKEMDF